MSDERTRGWTYVIFLVAMLAGVLIAVWHGDAALAGVLLAAMFPTGMAARNTSRAKGAE